MTPMYHGSPDDDVFRFLAKTYAKAHPRMHLKQENTCGPNNDGGFADGITNGADWYPVTGIVRSRRANETIIVDIQ